MYHDGEYYEDYKFAASVRTGRTGNSVCIGRIGRTAHIGFIDCIGVI